VTRARSVCAGVWDFVVGDPIVAVGVVVAIGVTAGLARVGVAAWWVMPVAVVSVLGASLRRAP
jgi:hydrogenase/urease accessory protein HupE